MALDHALAAAGQRPVQPRVQLVDQSSVGFLSRDKTGIARIDGTVKSGHCLPCTPDIACTPDSGRAARLVFFFRAAQPAAAFLSSVAVPSCTVPSFWFTPAHRTVTMPLPALFRPSPHLG